MSSNNSNDTNDISPGNGYVRELGEYNYTNGNGTEFGFWRHQVNSKHYFQCGFYEQNSNGEIFWCYYDQRLDHHKDYSGIHVHRTKKTTTTGPLDKHIRRTTTHIDKQYDIYSKIAHFIAISNISLNKGCSNELFRIIYASINFFRSNYTKLAKVPTEQIIPKIGAIKIREIMIETANQILTESISRLQYSRYLSICLDGGQTAQRHFIDFVVWSNKKSFSVFVKDTSSLTAQGYADLALECLNSERLSILQKKIVCFVGDGLRAQTAGLDPKSTESFQHRTGIGDFSKILFSPCYNHRIQNSFQKTYREMKLFRNIVNKVNNLAIFLRKPAQVKVLKKICPEPIVTRWQYIFNICTFLEKNLVTIKKIIDQQEFHKYDIDFDLTFFIKMIHPLRSETIILSKNKCCLSDVYPIVIEVLKQYKTLKLECNEDEYAEIIDVLVENIKYYTITSPQQSFLLLSYILTP